MKKVISSVLIFSLVLTIFASAMPGYQNNSVKMSDPQLSVSVGGWDWGCAVAIAGAGLMLAGLFVTPVGAVAVGMYAANAILGPAITGTGIGLSCSGSGGDKSSDMRTQYKFQRVN